jgi:hypothetical protein
MRRADPALPAFTPPALSPCARLAPTRSPPTSAQAPADTVGQFVGPAFLAAAALSFFGRATPFEGAAAAFGVALARRLPGPLVLWVASLAGAVYAGYAAEWAVGAFGLAAALRVAEAVRAKEVPAPAPALFLAFAVSGGCFPDSSENSSPSTQPSNQPLTTHHDSPLTSISHKRRLTRSTPGWPRRRRCSSSGAT